MPKTSKIPATNSGYTGGMMADVCVETNGLPNPCPATSARATLPCSQA